MKILHSILLAGLLAVSGSMFAQSMTPSYQDDYCPTTVTIVPVRDDQNPGSKTVGQDEFAYTMVNQSSAPFNMQLKWDPDSAVGSKPSFFAEKSCAQGVGACPLTIGQPVSLIFNMVSDAGEQGNPKPVYACIYKGLSNSNVSVVLALNPNSYVIAPASAWDKGSLCGSGAGSSTQCPLHQAS